jgi:hypothetical protein
VRGRPARWLLSAVILALVFIAGFATARLRPDHTATPRWISGTVTWSNADIHRVLFKADDNSGDSGEYEVGAIGRWNLKGGGLVFEWSSHLSCGRGDGSRPFGPAPR